MEAAREIFVEGLGPYQTVAALLKARVLVSACIMVVDTGITTWIERGMRDDLDALFAERADLLRAGFR